MAKTQARTQSTEPAAAQQRDTRIAQALRSSDDEAHPWTVHCLTPDEQVDLYEQGARHAQAARLRAHLAACAYCRSGFQEVRAALRMAALLAPVVLRDGDTTVTLDARGRLEGLEGMDRLLAALRRKVAAALKSPGRVVPPSVARPLLLLQPRSATFLRRGGATAAIAVQETPFRLTRPISTAVLEARPTFQWEPYQGAASYRVTLFARGRDVLRSAPSPEPRWRPEQPLAPSVYSWQAVAFTRNGQVASPLPPAPQPRFQVLAPERVAALERVREQFLHSPLALGVLYAQAGLLADAEAEFQKLHLANPQQQAAQRLLERVQQIRGVCALPAR